MKEAFDEAYGIDGAARKRRVAVTVGICIVLAVLIALIAGFSLGCWRADADREGAGEQGGASAETIAVTDSTGRSVDVPADGARIAGLDSFTSEFLVMIGAGDQLAGAPAGVKSDKLLCEMYPGLADVPVPMQSSAINIETLMAASPDVVVVKSSLAPEELAKIERAGIPYAVVEYSTMSEQMEAMSMLGQIAGGDAKRRADDLVAYYARTIEYCEGKTAQIPEGERVRVYHAINDALTTSGAKGLGTYWIEAAGGVNVAALDDAAANATDFNTSLEQIYVWNPDAIICSSASAVGDFAQGEQWAGLSAVQAGNVHAIPVGATRWGQRGSVETYLAMLWFGKTFYPELYADLDLKQEVVSYYRTYLGLEVDDATYEKMLSGVGLRSGAAESGAGGGNGSGGGGNGGGNGSGGGNGGGNGSGGGNA